MRLRTGARSLTSLTPLVALACAGACSTVGSEGRGDVGLPTSGVGPFRRLASGEVPGIAPFVLDGEGGYRDPAVLAEDPGASEPRVWLFAGALGAGAEGIPKGPVIVRTFAPDGRSFAGTGLGPGRGTELALAPTEAWEGGEAGKLGAPFVLRVGAEIWMFYAAAGGIGLARAPGPTAPFVKDPGPVLDARAAATWERGAPASPSAYVEGGRVHLFFSSGGFLGEAVAEPGARTFSRVDADPSTPELDPVLGPGPRVDPKSLAPGEKAAFDEAGVADPCVSVRTTPASAARTQVRVLYTGIAASGASAIGFAARYGHAGRLTRQPLAIYAAKGKERAPALLDLGERGYLYFTEPRSDGREGVGAGYAPAGGTPGPLAPRGE